MTTVTIGGIVFDHHRYDERSDVLYLSVGEPRPATRGLETEDGHAIHFAADVLSYVHVGYAVDARAIWPAHADLAFGASPTPGTRRGAGWRSSQSD